jgi:hypothetical protein
MSTSPATRSLSVIGRSAAGPPRTFRLEPGARPSTGRDAAYRRLAAVVLGVDVPTLALQLRLARSGAAASQARAA